MTPGPHAFFLSFFFFDLTSSRAFSAAAARSHWREERAARRRGPHAIHHRSPFLTRRTSGTDDHAVSPGESAHGGAGLAWLMTCLVARSRLPRGRRCRFLPSPRTPSCFGPQPIRCRQIRRIALALPLSAAANAREAGLLTEKRHRVCNSIALHSGERPKPRLVRLRQRCGGGTVGSVYQLAESSAVPSSGRRRCLVPSTD